MGGKRIFRIKSPQDFGAALVFVLIGLAGLYVGKDLRFGTAGQMGPGYFPTLLSLLILGLGVGIGLGSLAIKGPPIEPIHLRPILFIVSAVLIFGLVIDIVGLALTSVLLTLFSAYARPSVKLTETLLLGAGLAVFSVVVFVYLLGQAVPPWWGR